MAKKNTKKAEVTLEQVVVRIDELEARMSALEEANTGAEEDEDDEEEESVDLSAMSLKELIAYAEEEEIELTKEEKKNKKKALAAIEEALAEDEDDDEDDDDEDDEDTDDGEDDDDEDEDEDDDDDDDEEDEDDDEDEDEFAELREQLEGSSLKELTKAAKKAKLPVLNDKKFAKAKDAKKKEMLIEAILEQAQAEAEDDDDEDDEEDAIQRDLTDMDVDELKSIAKQFGLKPGKNATKKQLIKMLEDFAESQSDE